MSTYDSETKNGIPYFANLYSSNFEYKTLVTDLDNLYPVRSRFLTGKGTVTSYNIGSESLSRSQMSYSDCMGLWDRLMAKKAQLESGAKPRKAVGVVIRDW